MFLIFELFTVTVILLHRLAIVVVSMYALTHAF